MPSGVADIILAGKIPDPLSVFQEHGLLPQRTAPVYRIMSGHLKFPNCFWIALLLATCPVAPPAAGAATNRLQTNAWSLASPDNQCVISVALGDGGRLTYEARRNGKTVIEPSPLGLQRDDQDFEHNLSLERAGDMFSARQEYQLFAGVQPRVNHLLNYRNLLFRNENGLPLEIDLAASDEGVAFRYRFPDTNDFVRVVQTEMTGFTVSPKARGWMQPFHAASPYTPAYEDFYFPVSPGDRPPDSRARAVGWAFPALFHVPDAEPGFC